MVPAVLCPGANNAMTFVGSFIRASVFMGDDSPYGFSARRFSSALAVASLNYSPGVALAGDSSFVSLLTVGLAGSARAMVSQDFGEAVALLSEEEADVVL